MKPRPTEYKGIVFRSKTEAIFARCLDLRQKLWAYEPPWLRITDGYVPDFVIPAIGNHCGFSGIAVIEVKPASVTPVYHAEWVSRTEEIRRSVGVVPCMFVLQLGWGLGSEKPMTSFIREDGSEGIRPTEKIGWLSNMLDAVPEAKAYRFDLEDGDL